MSVAVLNHETLATLRILENKSAGLFGEILELYTVQSPLYLAAIRAGFLSGDARSVRLAAHTLKGSSANIGATAAMKLAEGIEFAPSGDGWEVRLARLVGEVETARAALSEVVSEMTLRK